MANTSKEQIEEDEMKILAELQRNSNESIDVIAKRCGFSRQKVWKIIKRLEEHRIIWGYTTVVDEECQGLQKFIILIKQTMKILDGETAEKVTIDEIKEEYTNIGITIESSHYIHGEYDWLLIFTAKDLIHAKKFSQLIASIYPEVIEKIYLTRVLYSPRNHHITNPRLLKVKEFI